MGGLYNIGEEVKSNRGYMHEHGAGFNDTTSFDIDKCARKKSNPMVEKKYNLNSHKNKHLTENFCSQ